MRAAVIILVSVEDKHATTAVNDETINMTHNFFRKDVVNFARTPHSETIYNIKDKNEKLFRKASFFKKIKNHVYNSSELIGKTTALASAILKW